LLLVEHEALLIGILYYMCSVMYCTVTIYETEDFSVNSYMNITRQVAARKAVLYPVYTMMLGLDERRS